MAAMFGPGGPFLRVDHPRCDRSTWLCSLTLH